MPYGIPRESLGGVEREGRLRGRQCTTRWDGEGRLELDLMFVRKDITWVVKRSIQNTVLWRQEGSTRSLEKDFREMVLLR